MFSLLFASLGVGALLGAFRAAVAETPTEKRLGTHVLTMGVLLFAMGCIPHIYVGVPVIMLVGFFGVSATTTANSLLQLTSESGRRGIVMSLWGMGFIGVGSFGYPLMGMIGEWFGGRAPFLVSGCVLILVVLFWHRRLASSSRHKMQD
jgi:MFS family permease